MNELLNFDGTFDDIGLNVNDKVRIVRKSGIALTGTITGIGPMTLSLNDDYGLAADRVDTIEVIERAPPNRACTSRRVHVSTTARSCSSSTTTTGAQA
jgi:hypothetical protein